MANGPSSRTLVKARQYLDAARMNLSEDRLFPAAEETFRAVETVLEAMLQDVGVGEIVYPGDKTPFKGRLALQLLVRDRLLREGRITGREHQMYQSMYHDFHRGGYASDATFSANEIERYLDFADQLFSKAQSRGSK